VTTNVRLSGALPNAKGNRGQARAALLDEIRAKFMSQFLLPWLVWGRTLSACNSTPPALESLEMPTRGIELKRSGSSGRKPV
jgi:hypothetical protein